MFDSKGENRDRAGIEAVESVGSGFGLGLGYAFELAYGLEKGLDVCTDE